MSLDHINDAFKQLALLNEEAFDTSLDGLNNLSDFMEQDDVEDVIKVIDPEAETEADLQDSYIGKVIINCNICHSHIFKNKEDITINEDGIVNIDMQCPYCGEQEGFTVVGEIAEFKPESDDSDPKVKVDGEEIPSADTDTALEEDFNPTSLEDYLKDVEQGEGWVTLEKAVDDMRVLNSAKSEEEIEDFITNYDRAYILNFADIQVILTPTAPAYDIIGKELGISEEDLGDILTESVNNVNVETDDSIVNVHTDEGGKVVVSTEPKEITTNDEMVVPVSDDTIREIEDNNLEGVPQEETDNTEEAEEQDVEIDEIDEEGLDELGEAYLTKVYNNVNSFKTTAVSTSDSKMIIEGLITFKSGVQKKTGFIFEAQDINRLNQVRFIGKNAQLSRGKKSFILTGKLVDKKLIPESFTYNYRAKNAEGKSEKLYGTINKKK